MVSYRWDTTGRHLGGDVEWGSAPQIPTVLTRKRKELVREREDLKALQYGNVHV